jgi:hypothetical protein
MVVLITNVRTKIKKRLLASVVFLKKTPQNEVTLEGTFINYEGSVKGFLAQMLESLKVR